MTEEILTAKLEIAQAVANIRKLADEIMKLRRVAGTPVTMRIASGVGVGGGARGMRGSPIEALVSGMTGRPPHVVNDFFNKMYATQGQFQAKAKASATGFFKNLYAVQSGQRLWTSGADRKPAGWGGALQFPRGVGTQVNPLLGHTPLVSEVEKHGKSIFGRVNNFLFRSMSIFFLFRRMLLIVEGIIKFGANLFIKTFTGIIGATEKWRTAEESMGGLVGKKGGKRLAEIAYEKGIEYPSTSGEFMESFRRIILASPQFSKKLKESPEALEKYANMYAGVYARLKYMDSLVSGGGGRDPTVALVQAIAGHQWRGLRRYGVLPKTVTGGGLPRVGPPTLEALSKYLAGTPEKPGRISESVLLAAGHRPVGQMKSFASIMERAYYKIGGEEGTGKKGLLDIVGEDFYEFNQKFKKIVDSDDAQAVFAEISEFFVEKFKWAAGEIQGLFDGIDLKGNLQTQFDQFVRNVESTIVRVTVKIVKEAGQTFLDKFIGAPLRKLGESAFYLLSLQTPQWATPAYRRTGRMGNVASFNAALYGMPTESGLSQFVHYGKLSQGKHPFTREQRAQFDRTANLFNYPNLFEPIPIPISSETPEETLSRTALTRRKRQVSSTLGSIGKFVVDSFTVNSPIQHNVTPLEGDRLRWQAKEPTIGYDPGR